MSIEPLVMAYNHNLIKRPVTGYQDLLRPELQGRLGTSELVAPSVIAWYDWLEKTQGPDFLEVWYRGNNWISFESDEATVFELWKRFRSVGIWASDYPHFDSEDAWEALEHMQEYGVPKEAVTRMMGSNALDMFGIAPGLAVKQQATTSA